MGTRLIFRGLAERRIPKCVRPYRIGRALAEFLEIALPYRPYPKPTQVDR